MRTGERAGEVFDALLERGLVAVYPTDAARQAAVTSLQPDGGRVIADTCEQVAALNAAVRDRRLATGETVAGGAVTTGAGDRIGPGDQIATRRNDRDLGVTNRDRWIVIGVDDAAGLRVRGRAGDRTLPPRYVRQHVELAYATTVHAPKARPSTAHTSLSARPPVPPRRTLA